MRYYGMGLLVLQVLCGSHDLMSSQQESVATGTEHQQRVKDHRTHVDNHTRASDSDTSDTAADKFLCKLKDYNNETIDGIRNYLKRPASEAEKKRNDLICIGCCSCCMIFGVLFCNHLSLKAERISARQAGHRPSVMGGDIKSVCSCCKELEDKKRT